MADPTAYAVEYSFSGFQANAPGTPLPAGPVDNEFAAIATSVRELVASIKDVRRSDGALKNGIVTLDSLSAGVLAGLANLDSGAAALIDTAIAAIQTNVDADIAALDAAKADLVHTHAATEVTIAAITGIVGTTVQAALAELRLMGPKPGDYVFSLSPTPRVGYLRCDDGTIGNAGSTATSLASATAWPLYEALYDNTIDTYAPVTGGRGLSAAADFAALKPIALTKILGRALAVCGTGSGLTGRALGVPLGLESAALAQAELPNITLATTIAAGQGAHTHPITPGTVTSGPQYSAGATGQGSAVGASATDSATLPAMSGTTPLGGSGTAISKMQPTAFTLHAFLRL